MKQEADNPFLIKQLYQKKFYQHYRPKGVIDKVIAFQKKIQEPKTYRKPLYQTIHQNLLLQDQTFRFRPSTNYSLHRTKRDVNSSLQSERAQGLTTQLAFRLQNKANQKRASSRSQTRKIAWTPQEYTSRLSKMEFTSYLEDRKAYTSSRKRQRRNGSSPKRKMSMNIANNQSNKVASKKVFIGGRDLEKAAEEYFSHYKQLKKKQEEYQKRNYLARRQNFESRKARLLAKQSAVKNLGDGNRKQKMKKQDDLMFNNDFAPWKVDIEHF